MHAAAIDGASRRQVFWRLTVPPARRSPLTGLAPTWATGNFPGHTQTMPPVIYLGSELDLDVAVTLSAILVAFSFVVLLLSTPLQKQPKLDWTSSLTH